jgi:hypothetical protein
MRNDRRALLTVGVWLAGAAWILIPHRGEGRVVMVISQRHQWGVHLTDPIGVVVPAVVTLLLYGTWLREVVPWRRSARR